MPKRASKLADSARRGRRVDARRAQAARSAIASRMKGAANAAGAPRATEPSRTSKGGSDMNRAKIFLDARVPALIGLGLLTASLLGDDLATAGPAPKATRVAAAASGCLTYAELEHCALASATLELAANRLTVRNPARSSDAGVSIELPDARTWSGAMRGVATSEVEAKRTGTGFAFAAAFTGNEGLRTYSALVYRDGVLQGSMGNIPSHTQGIWINLERETTSLFVVNPSGGCSWEFRYSGAPIAMKLPNGVQLMGDEVKLVEEVKPSGGYPYTTFDGLTFRGDFNRIDFTAETFE
jgi:hypothetical protein